MKPRDLYRQIKAGLLSPDMLPHLKLRRSKHRSTSIYATSPSKPLTAMAPPTDGWQILAEPTADSNYPGVIFVKFESKHTKMNSEFKKLQADIRFLYSNRARKIIIEMPNEIISDHVLELLKELKKELEIGQIDPYSMAEKDPPIKNGKLAFVYPNTPKQIRELKDFTIFTNKNDAAKAII